MQSTHATHSQRWNVSPLIALFLTLLVGLALFMLFVVGFTEQYFAPAPAIGTLFSANYSEAKFDQIRAGMTETEVVELIGDPLSKDRFILSFNQGERSATMPANSTVMWSYSNDNARGIWDFAWLGRFVYFDEAGRVTGTLEWVFYD